MPSSSISSIYLPAAPNRTTLISSNLNPPRVMGNDRVYYILFDHILDNDSEISPDNWESEFLFYLYRVDPYGINEGTVRPVVPTNGKRIASHSLGKPIFRFVSDKYPLCMGCGVLGTKLFFLGGYFPCQGNAVRDAPRNYSERLYILDTTFISDATTEKEIEEQFETQDCKYVNKSSPIVVTFGNRLYVLPKNFGAEDNICPSIQSYEPHSNTWKSFDIFEDLQDDPAFSHFPTSSIRYDVLAHCVKGSEIIAVLYVGAFSFNVENEKLQRIGSHTHSLYAIPFIGPGAYVGGCVFGLNESNEFVYGYKDSPFGVPLVTRHRVPLLPKGLCTCAYSFSHAFSDSWGFAMHLEDAGENKLLAVRSGIRYSACLGRASTRKTIYLTLDFLDAMKDAKGAPKCRGSHSTTYHMEERDGCHNYVRACFPIVKNSVRDDSSMGESDFMMTDVSYSPVVLGPRRS